MGGTSACTEGDADSGAAHCFALSGSPPGEPEANDPHNPEFEKHDECSRTDAEAGNSEFVELLVPFNVGDITTEDLEHLKARKASGPKEGKSRNTADDGLRAREPWLDLCS